MKVNVETEDGVVVVRPSGKLDAITSPHFQESMNEIIKENGQGEGQQRVVIDMTDVPYVSSAGLRVIIRAAKTIMGNGKLAVTGLSSSVQQVFELAGFEKIMSICADLETAKQNV